MIQSSGKPRLMPEQANRLLLHATPVPPVAHAYHHWDEATRTLTYTYNNRRLIELRIPGAGRVSFRHGSDGTLQGMPLVQQVYVMLTGETVQATVTFELSAEALNMRPQRAGRDQAILGQVGRSLLPGANGLYDVTQDLFVAWFGKPWHWTAPRLQRNERGNLVATMQVELGPQTWAMTIKPHYYRQHLGYRYHQPWAWRPNPKPVAGWCTWEAYRRDITEENVLAGTRFMAEKLRPYGLEYVQVDDGYERLPFPADTTKTIAENWLETGPAFPSGHAGLTRQIKAAGFEPGVWITACCANDAWADVHPECFLKDSDGQILIGDWVKYAPTCTPEFVDEHFRPCYRGMRDAGYTYFKIDGIRHVLYDGLHEAVLRGVLSNEEAEHRFRQFLEAGREELGPDMYWLSSWGVLTQMVGLCDACRIAQDAKPEWSGMQMQIVESARWFFTQRVLFTNDPDHVCARAPLEWTRSLLSLVSLSGGLYMLSDPIDSYDADRVRIAQQTLPPLATITSETGPLDTTYPAFSWTKLHGFAFAQDKEKAAAEAKPSAEEEAYNMAGCWETLDADHPFSTLWAIHLDTSAGRWCVAGRFAAIPLPESHVSLEQLALPADCDMLVFDFWAQQFLGRVRDGIDCPALPVGHCQILAVRAACDRPQLVSSSRHVSQDAVSVHNQCWDTSRLLLEVEGVRGTRETYWVHLPAGWQLDTAQGSWLTVRIGDTQTIGDDRVVGVEVMFPAGSDDCAHGVVLLAFRRGGDGE